MTPQEIAKIQTFLRRKFANERLKVTRRKQEDSAEVMLGDEHIGVIYRDEDEGELSYAFNMAILEMDLED